MISNWEYFRESVKHKLSIEIVEDLFLPIQDSGYKLEVCFAIEESSDWIPIYTYEYGPIYKIAYYVICEVNMGEINDLDSFLNHSNLISQISSISKRIQSNYDCIFHIEMLDSSINIAFEKDHPTIFDACTISYVCLSNYMSELLQYMPNYISPGKFVEDNNNYYIEFEINEDILKSDKSISVEEFQDNITKFIKNDFGKCKFDSIKKIKNKYIIKNFISTDDIKFKY